MATRAGQLWHRLFGEMEPPKRSEVWLLAAGVALRLTTLVLLIPQQLDPDAGNYRALAQRFSWAGPLGAGYGEPLWIAIVKFAIAPFGYSPVAYRVLTTLLSILVMILAWRVFQRLLSPRARPFALAFVALNGLLAFIAPRGLREETVTALMLLGVLSIVKLYRDSGRGWGLIVAIVAIPLVRLEIGMFLIVVLGVASVKAPPLRRLVAVGMVIGVVLVVPWLVSNAHGLGDPLYHSNTSATYFRNADLGDLSRPLSSEMTWAEYYLEFLGPGESAKRLFVGIPSLLGSLFYNSLLPIRPERILESLPSLRPLVDVARIVAGAGAILVAGVTLLGLVRGRPRSLMWIATIFALLGITAYAPLSRHLTVNYRLIAFTVPFIALVVGAGAEAFLELRERRQAEGAT